MICDDLGMIEQLGSVGHSGSDVKLHDQVRSMCTALLRNELPPSWAALSFQTARPAPPR